MYCTLVLNWYDNDFSVPFGPLNFFVFQWYSMLQNYVEVQVAERKRMECDPLRQLRTSDHQLCLIHPYSQMDRMHRRNSRDFPSLFPPQHTLQPQVIFLTTKIYITYFQQSLIFVSLLLFNDSVSNSRLYNLKWLNDCEPGKYPEGSRSGSHSDCGRPYNILFTIKDSQPNK
jgi:hypothetical protein